MEHIVSITGYLAAPLTGIVAWFAGRRKNNNDFLHELQKSIGLLTTENTKLIERVVTMNQEIIDLKKENRILRNEVEELNKKLENVKTITRTK
jgi:peptidoglycan hydrolase CwlO-like protein